MERIFPFIALILERLGDRQLEGSPDTVPSQVHSCK